MRWKVLATIGVCAAVVTGCVQAGKYEKTRAELLEARRASAQTATALDSFKKQAAGDIKTLEAEQARLTKGMLAAQRALEQTQSDMETTQHRLAKEQQDRRQAEGELAQLREERDFLQRNVGDLTQRLSIVEQELGASKELLGEADTRLVALEQEESRLTNELFNAQDSLAHTQRFLESAERRLASQEQGTREAENNLLALREKNQRFEQMTDTLRRDRDFYQTTMDDLQRQLEVASAELAGMEEPPAEAASRIAEAPQANGQALIAALEREKEETLAALAEARSRGDFLEATLAEEQAKVAGLEDDNQRLLMAAEVVDEDVARVVTEPEEPEVDTARVDELQTELGKQEQEIGDLRLAVTDREMRTAKVAALTEELEQSGERINVLSGDLSTLHDEMARLRQEREDLSGQVGDLEETIRAKDLAFAQSTEEKGLLEAQLEQERSPKDSDPSIVTASREDLSRLSEMQEAERARLEKELREALDAEIAKGEVRIQQIRERLKIDVVDRMLFDSGRVRIKQAGVEVLTRVSDVLKDVTDRIIRIEGHTDSVPIGPKIIDQFPSNWELSTARATSVVRYLVDKGGLDEADMAAVGSAYTRPVASNDTTEGRAENRRIEIVLYPKNLSASAGF